MRDLGGKKANSVGVNMLSTSGHEKRIKMGVVGSPLGSGEAELLNSRHEHKGGGERKRKPVSAWEAQEDFPQKAISALITL